MSTEQHEAPTKRCRCPALAEAYAKLQEKSLAQHALIVQFHTAFEGEHFEHADQRAAITAATQYLTRGPKT